MNKEDLLIPIEEVRQNINILEEQLEGNNCGCDIEIQIKSEKLKLEALEKQVPKKPLSASKSGSIIYWQCPSCHHYTLGKYSHRYCPWCGQGLDWENEDKN